MALYRWITRCRPFDHAARVSISARSFPKVASITRLSLFRGYMAGMPTGIFSIFCRAPSATSLGFFRALHRANHGPPLVAHHRLDEVPF